MPTKFFFAENAGRIIAGIRFEIFDISAGTAVGVYKTDDEALAEKIKATPGVFDSTEAEYLDCIKKKQPKFDSWNTSNPVSAPAPVSIKGPGNVVVVEGQSEPEQPVSIGTVVEESDALKVETISAPTSVVVPAGLVPPSEPTAPVAEAEVAPAVEPGVPSAETVTAPPKSRGNRNR